MTNDPSDPAASHSAPSPGTPPAIPAQQSQAAPVYPPPITLPTNTAAPNADERTNGMLIHLLAIFSGWLGPLILWLVRKDQSPFLDHHGKEALNFQISFMIIAFCVMAVGMVLAFVTMGFGMLLLFPLWILMIVFALVWEIQACMAANRGEWYRYPCTMRFIP